MLIRVRVKAGVRRETFIEVDEGRYEITVRQKAQSGAANQRALTLLARHLRVPQKRVRIVSGHTQPSKKFEVS